MNVIQGRFKDPPTPNSGEPNSGWKHVKGLGRCLSFCLVTARQYPSLIPPGDHRLDETDENVMAGVCSPWGFPIPPSGAWVCPPHTGNTKLILFMPATLPALCPWLRKEQMYACNRLIPAAFDIIV